jgi:hypothetical protein
MRGWTRPAGTVLVWRWLVVSVSRVVRARESGGRLLYQTQFMRRVPGVKEPVSGGIT